ncbi:MAG: hypothetical protein DI535_10630 [Citrobacter freundii]|nr:MAG: hypothetical protein DI535_10630 [Citrobacter freundii]
MSSERQLLEADNPWWGEHVHRYQEMVPYIGPEDKILDLACGTGFGSDILAGHTRGIVIGGDIAADAIDDCNRIWKRPNLQFRVLDGTNLPFEDNFFDKIASFETIEHTTMYREMLREFLRVLKPGGIAFISTPNFPVNSPSGKVTNPYHTQEFTYDELHDILQSVFQDTKMTGQKYSRYDSGKVPAIGKFIEFFFGIIGIRKLPYSIKNGVSKFFTRKPFYPEANDYTMVASKTDAIRCKTLFCICRK